MIHQLGHIYKQTKDTDTSKDMPRVNVIRLSVSGTVEPHPLKHVYMLTAHAHDADVNAISWIRKEPFIVSGGDDGVLKIIIMGLEAV